MQHDVCLNPGRRVRAQFPFVVVLQADIALGKEALCAPLLAVEGHGAPPAKATPSIVFEGRTFRLVLPRMAAVPVSYLRRPAGSVASYRDDIIVALDWLFTGI